MKDLIERVTKELNATDYNSHVEFISGIMLASKERLEKEVAEMRQRSDTLQAASNELNEYINKTFKQ